MQNLSTILTDKDQVTIPLKGKSKISVFQLFMIDKHILLQHGEAVMYLPFPNNARLIYSTSLTYFREKTKTTPKWSPIFHS